ncbi:MAG: transporter substrate-binding domain-containing protein [Halopseudomonas sp.]
MHKQLLLLLCTLFLFPYSAKGAEEISFVGDAWPPFNNAIGQPQEGYFIDIARAIYEPLGYKVSYHTLPWKRSVSWVKEGHYNALLGPFKSEAPGFIFPEEEVGKTVLSFFTTKKSNWQFNGIESLKDVKLGIVQSYDYRPWLQQFRQRHPDNFLVVAGNNAIEKNLELLIRGRIDTIPSNESSFLYRAKSSGISDQIRLAGRDNLGGSKSLYIAFSPALEKSALYAELFSKGVRRLRGSGELQLILDQYGLIDWADQPAETTPPTTTVSNQ